MSSCISGENRTDAFNDFIHELVTQRHILIALRHKVWPGLFAMSTMKYASDKSDGRKVDRKCVKAVGVNCACEKGKRREYSCRHLQVTMQAQTPY